MAPARLRPVWLAAPGRWSGLRAARARLVLIAIVLLALLTLAATPRAPQSPIDGPFGLSLVDAVRHGGAYYATVADDAREVGTAVSVWSTPLPTLVLVEAWVPSWIASSAMMALAVAAIVAWYARAGGELTSRRARAIALLLMLVGISMPLRLALVAVPEGWAGLLVALSLARWKPGRTIEPAALGLAAATLSIAALPYAAVMLLTARRDRREIAAWALVLAIGLALLLLHRHALALALPGGGSEAAVRVAAPGRVLATLAAATGLRLLPVALAPLVAVLATIGWASRRGATELRVVLLIAAEGMAVAIGLPAAALVVTPLLPLGLIALPDAVRALASAALDRRRITVTSLGRKGLVR